MRDRIRPLLAEGFGTFALVFIGAGSVVMNQSTNGALGLIGVAFAHGVVLSVAVTATMNISGAHLNPAVSLGLFAARKIALNTLLSYIVAQLVAAVLAAVAIRLTLPALAGEVTAYGVPRLSATVTFRQAVALEVILTFFLMSAVFGTAVSSEAPRVGGFGIGLTVFFCTLVGGPLTGAALNPARAFGPAVVSGSWTAQAVYWIGPTLGALLGAVLWRFGLLPGSTERAT